MLLPTPPRRPTPTGRLGPIQTPAAAQLTGSKVPKSRYEWILEGDIASCFDEISHSALVDRVRARIADKRVLALVKAFLIAGILTEDGAVRGSKTGTPQGGIETAPTQSQTSSLSD